MAHRNRLADFSDSERTLKEKGITHRLCWNSSQATGCCLYHQANGRLQVIQVGQGSEYPAGIAGAEEAAMDVEYTSGMAPGATIDYYPAPDTTQGNPTLLGLDEALN